MAHNYGQETLELLYPIRTDVKEFRIGVREDVSYKKDSIGVSSKVFNHITSGSYFSQFGGDVLVVSRIEKTKRSERYFMQIAQNFETVVLSGQMINKFHNSLQHKYPQVDLVWSPEMIIENTHITYSMCAKYQYEFPYNLPRIHIAFEPEVRKEFADSYDYVAIVSGELMESLIPVNVETCKPMGNISSDQMAAILESCNWKHIDFTNARCRKLSRNITLSPTILSIKPESIANIFSDQLETNNSYLYNSRFARVKAIVNKKL